MHKPQLQVHEFHQKLGATIGSTPEIRDAELRARLILEEAIETAVALVGSWKAKDLIDKLSLSGTDDHRPDFVEVIDGLCDILYVTYGTAVACGVDLEPFYDEVHRSNISKAGGPRRADGKIMKPADWQPPRIAEMLSTASPALYPTSISRSYPGPTDRCKTCLGEFQKHNYSDSFIEDSSDMFGHMYECRCKGFKANAPVCKCLKFEHMS